MRRTFLCPQGKIPDALWQQDGLPANEISWRTGLASSTLTSMIDRMEKAGLVERRRSTDDRRVVRIFLGRKAQACKEQYTAASAKMTEIYFRGFTDEEITSFENALQRVLDNVRDADRNENWNRSGVSGPERK